MTRGLALAASTALLVASCASEPRRVPAFKPAVRDDSTVERPAPGVVVTESETTSTKDTTSTADQIAPETTESFGWLPILVRTPNPAVYFETFGVNPTVETAARPDSTLAVQPDTASFGLAMAYLNAGELPPPRSVRTEAFINAMAGAAAGASEPPPAPDDVGVTVRTTASPSRRGYHVLEISITAPTLPRGPADLVIITTEALAADDRAAVQELIARLGPDDRVALIAAGVATDLMPAANVNQAFDQVQPDAALSLPAALRKASATNRRDTNRRDTRRHIAVYSSGAGVDASGVASIEGSTSWVVGVGRTPYDDRSLSHLASHLGARYRHSQSGGFSLSAVVIEDLSIRVRFDEQVVSRYRLLGYERHLIEGSAGAASGAKLHAGESVTALYEVRLTAARGPLGVADLRFRHTPSGATGARRVSMTRDSGDAHGLSLAVVAAAFAEKLRGGYWSRALSWRDLAALGDRLPAGISKSAAAIELTAAIDRAARLDRRGDPFESGAPLADMQFDHVPILAR